VYDYLEEIELTEWTESTQRTSMQNPLFKDYKEFDTYFGIDRSATFYAKAATIIKEVFTKDVKSRVKWEADKPSDELKTMLRQAAAFKIIAEACLRMDSFYLPGSVAGELDNEFNRSQNFNSYGSKAYVRERLAGVYNAKADNYFTQCDFNIAQENKTQADDPYTAAQVIPNEDNKHITML